MLIQVGKTSITVTYMVYDVSAPNSGLVGATPTVQLVKNGTVTGASTNPSVEVDSVNAPGLYKLVLTAADLSVIGDLVLVPSAGSGVVAPQTHQVVGWDPTDPLMFSASIVDNLGSHKYTWGELLEILLASSPVATFSNVVDSTVSPVTQTIVFKRGDGTTTAFTVVNHQSQASNGSKYWSDRVGTRGTL